VDGYDFLGFRPTTTRNDTGSAVLPLIKSVPSPALEDQLL